MTLPRLALLPFLLALLLPAAAVAAGEPLWLGRFAAGDEAIPAPWQVEHFDRRVAPTRYRLRLWDGVPAIEARAHNSMALLARPLAADLGQTPILCWRWRIDAPVAAADMTRKSGDDYAARVYLSFAVPPKQLGLATRAKLRLARTLYGAQVPDAAVNYVWDNRQPVGTLQDNAYTERTRMLVLRSGAAEAGRWVEERRDLVADFRRAFGELAGRPSGLAIASDTDNTGGEALAGFADFHLVGRDQPCQFGSAR